MLENFLLFCPRRKQETIINVKQLNLSVIKAPDTKT
ncbi:MAG TPA: cysteine-rich KTR domain-containing protein [Phototrophicaceae bacterium]|nr:cysteine-rich KTR domain-containing protein [Phototrophicaceae bacterium]